MTEWSDGFDLNLCFRMTKATCNKKQIVQTQSEAVQSLGTDRAKKVNESWSKVKKREMTRVESKRTVGTFGSLIKKENIKRMFS